MITDTQIPEIALKEVRKIMLIPLEETTAVKELIQIKLEEGKKEGIKEGKKEIALNLLKKGMDTKFISQVTGLTVKEIKQLKLI